MCEREGGRKQDRENVCVRERKMKRERESERVCVCV